MPSAPDANAIHREEIGAGGGLLLPGAGPASSQSSCGWRLGHQSSGGHIDMGQTRSAHGDMATFEYLGSNQIEVTRCVTIFGSSFRC